MRNKKNYIALLGMMVTLLAVSCGNNCENKVENSNADAALEAIMTRTSIRSYTDRQVSADTIELILKAGMAAPTARNSQPWAFVVVTDKALLQEMADSLPNRMLREAAFAIVACGDATKMLEGEGSAYWIQDVSAATENMLIAINALGLGAVWTGGFPASERVAAIKKSLNLPDKFIPLNVIPVGYPAEKPQPKNKWNESNIYYNRFAAEQ